MTRQCKVVLSLHTRDSCLDPTHEEGDSINSQSLSMEPRSLGFGAHLYDDLPHPSIMKLHYHPSPPWKISVRISTTGKDIKVQVSDILPFTTLAEVRQHVLCHLNTPCQFHWVYRGRLLQEETWIVPDAIEEKEVEHANVCRLPENGILQAMMLKTNE
ncbi:hypothetical protein BDF14DRAFT_566795 [Spinellus fusiger]|nr:hypothetical protein BDF14DRAFT_566795 [Spinellus fusiger]